MILIFIFQVSSSSKSSNLRDCCKVLIKGILCGMVPNIPRHSDRLNEMKMNPLRELGTGRASFLAD